MDKVEDIKMVKHSQHARIIKEDDELWISSEDLNTENSSDEDGCKSKHAFKKKVKLKHRRRSSPNIKLQRPDSSNPSTSKDVDQRLLFPTSKDHSFRSDESKTSDEETSIPPISSDSLSKRLSLEDWKPMKGALNISSLDEAGGDTSTRKILNQTSNFYNAMLYKLKSLKSCSVLKSVGKEKSKENEEKQETKTFKFLKNTPEVKEKLDFIKKLDDEISETINKYKIERASRLSTEYEVCRDISDNKISQEQDTQSFLHMCNFKELEKKTENDESPVYIGEDMTSDEESQLENNVEMETDNTTLENIETSIREDIIKNSSNLDFIKRNINAAKEGVMASFSITDEQKSKIAEILNDIDDFQLNDVELTISVESLAEKSDNDYYFSEKYKNDNVSDANGFTVSERDAIRIGEIDNELEKFSQETSEKDAITISDDQFWKQYVLDQKLKEIDLKLEDLYQSYLEDEKILRNEDNNDTLE